MRIIGLTGHAQHGKNTTADIIAETAIDPVVVVGFADALREFVSLQNPYVGEYDRNQLRYNDAVDGMGYEDAKNRPELDVRRLLQATGTEAARKVFGPDVWITALAHKVSQIDNQDTVVVVTDVRFENECDWIQENGTLVGVIRWQEDGYAFRAPGLDLSHASEAYIPTALVRCARQFSATDVPNLRAQVKAWTWATLNLAERV